MHLMRFHAAMKTLQYVAALANAADGRSDKNMILLLFYYFNGKLQQNITDHNIKHYELCAVEPNFGLKW